MINHVVMFKLAQKDRATAQELHDRLMALPDKIAQIRHYEVGINMLETPRSFDLVLISRFDSLAALSEYQAHPDHQAVLEFIRSVTSSIVAVDYEMD
ncbi:MAG: Dabb family protein [Chloroflexota bacterium]